jgi:hypothetical protein
MAAFRTLHSMELSDDEKLDHLEAAEKRRPMPPEVPDTVPPPQYPPELQFRVREADFPALGLDPMPVAGTAVRFAAMVRATSVEHEIGGCRIESEIDFLKFGDGPFAELDPAQRPTLAFTRPILARLDCAEDCERGHLLHLIGTARVESTGDTQWGGKNVTLQIVEMAVEDEDAESDGVS